MAKKVQVGDIVQLGSGVSFRVTSHPILLNLGVQVKMNDDWRVQRARIGRGGTVLRA